MEHHHQEGNSRSFIMPAFLAFALVFCLFVLMSRCKGTYVMGGAHHEGTEQHAGGHKTEGHEEHATEATGHKTADSTEHKAADSSGHKAEAHPAEAEHH